MKSSRRNFLKTSGIALGAITLLNKHSFALSTTGNTVKSFGFQTWTIKEDINNDLAGTCKKMADFGYKELEMCSPLGYSDAGFAPLNKLSGKELRKIIEDNGLKCTSSHFNLGELQDSLDNRIEWAHQLGMKQMILSSFWLPKEKQTIENYRKSAAGLNIIAEKVKASGFQMGFHNHNMEFEKRGNELIYDALLAEFDPNLVKMQFQVAVANIGYKAADFFRKYPGRFISAHLSDWNKAKDAQVPIGQGIIDWPDFFEAAKIGGVKNFFVEMGSDTFESSAKYLSSL
jgi:sugar phosphate isomerase/epimerase